MDSTSNNLWKIHFYNLIRRFCVFFKNPINVGYFSIVIVVVGSFGVWVSAIGQHCCNWDFFTNSNTITNLTTYNISICAATMADFLLSNKERGRGIKLFSFSVFLLALICSIVSLYKLVPVFVYIGLALTYILWITVFADDENKSIIVNNNAPVGGTSPQNSSLSGNLIGYTS